MRVASGPGDCLFGTLTLTTPAPTPPSTLRAASACCLAAPPNLAAAPLQRPRAARPVDRHPRRTEGLLPPRRRTKDARLDGAVKRQAFTGSQVGRDAEKQCQRASATMPRSTACTLSNALRRTTSGSGWMLSLGGKRAWAWRRFGPLLSCYERRDGRSVCAKPRSLLAIPVPCATKVFASGRHRLRSRSIVRLQRESSSTTRSRRAGAKGGHGWLRRELLGTVYASDATQP
uniref:Uncharacterized protein n=1 Tax=Mycena chlorophos TaxID=658473 RepID=A0ABQ0KZZ4_MYCCL|nr:predicted protein [Mycena chlorophos]